MNVLAEGKQILSNISLDILKGQVIALVGLNGSGKSTLIKAIAGDPQLEVSGDIEFNNKKINHLSPDERSKLGIFMSFQTPPEIEGIKTSYFLQYVYNKESEEVAKKLKLKSSSFSKDLNVGFSGGEKKKLELLQVYLKMPALTIFDEIDSGLDVDSLKKVGELIKELKAEGKAVLVVTHYNRIFSQIKPDKVYVLLDGRIVEQGDAGILKILEKDGFSRWA